MQVAPTVNCTRQVIVFDKAYTWRYVCQYEKGVCHDQVLVLVVALGLRRKGSRADVYELARRVLRLRLLEEPQAYAVTEENPGD